MVWNECIHHEIWLVRYIFGWYLITTPSYGDNLSPPGIISGDIFPRRSQGQVRRSICTFYIWSSLTNMFVYVLWYVVRVFGYLITTFCIRSRLFFYPITTLTVFVFELVLSARYLSDHYLCTIRSLLSLLDLYVWAIAHPITTCYFSIFFYCRIDFMSII
jgi:hypothetical protein